MSVCLNPDCSSNSSYFLNCFSGAFAELRKESSRLSCLTLCPSVRLSTWENLAHTGPFFVNIYIGNLHSTLSRMLNFGYNRTKISGTSHEDLSWFMVIICWILSARRDFSNKVIGQNHNTFFMSKTFSQQLCLLRDNYKKFVTSRHAVGDHTPHGAK